MSMLHGFAPSPIRNCLSVSNWSHSIARVDRCTGRSYAHLQGQQNNILESRRLFKRCQRLHTSDGEKSTTPRRARSRSTQFIRRLLYGPNVAWFVSGPSGSSLRRGWHAIIFKLLHGSDQIAVIPSWHGQLHEVQGSLVDMTHCESHIHVRRVPYGTRRSC